MISNRGITILGKLSFLIFTLSTSTAWCNDSLKLELKNENGEIVYLNQGDPVQLFLKYTDSSSNQSFQIKYKGDLKLTSEGKINIDNHSVDESRIAKIKTVEKSERNWSKNTGWIVLGSGTVISVTSAFIFLGTSNTDILTLAGIGILMAPTSTVFFGIWNAGKVKNKYQENEGWQFTVVGQNF